MEPRDESGKLDVKYYNPDDPKGFINGISEDDLFKWYFRHHPEEETASMEQLVAFLRERGLAMRKKTW
ncbi:MAG: hypothetical protein WC343_00780 [Bacilli bacterium]